MRVVVFLLKCLVGLFAAVGFVVVVAVLWLGAIVSEAALWEQVSPEREVPDITVLALDFAGGVIETRPDNPLARAARRDVVVMRDSLAALEAAGRDPRVKGLVARVGRGPLRIAQIQELRDAIKGFRDQGKFTLAFAETFGEAGDGTRHYYLASAFDQVWLQPSGDLDLTGLLLESPFLRGALDKLGIEPQLGQREEFKCAMNTLTDTGLPEPQRRNLQRLVDSWLGQIAADVAETRGLAPDRVRALIDGGPYMAEDALEANLVDRLGYWDELGETVEQEAGEDAEILALADYARAREAEEPDGPVVGLIYGLGPVQLDGRDADPAFGPPVMSADTVSQAISDALDDEEVAAIVFRIDSPGGSYVASDVIWREMQRAREEGKPVIVSMGGLAASGGYFVALPAQKIVALPGTVTGSIGVVAGKLVLSGLWDKLGVNWDGVQAGENAGIWSMNRAFTGADWQRLNDRLDSTYADFTAKVAAGRGLPVEKVQQAAKGQVWTGEDALSLGLVDELGGFRRAVALAAEAAGAAPEEVRLKRFPAERDPFKALIEDTLGAAVNSPDPGALLRALSRLVRALEPLVEAAERLRADPRGRSLMTPEPRPAG